MENQGATHQPTFIGYCPILPKIDCEARDRKSGLGRETTTAGMYACVNAMESTARGMAARSFAGASSDRLRVTILDLDGWKWKR